MRLLLTALLLNTLAGCGAPGSDTVFTEGNPKLKTADTTAAKAPPMRLATRTYGGLYHRLGDDNQFQPCGTRVLLDIVGTPQARALLKERFRWSAVWQGAKMYGVFQGAIVTDTPDTRRAGNEGVRPEPRTRFFIVGVDSLRPWRADDCGGMRSR